MSQLAEALYCQDKLEEAEAMKRRAYVGTERVFGKEHLHTLDLQSDLARIYYQQQKHDVSFTLLKDTIGKYMEALGPQHPRTLYYVEIYESYRREVSKAEEGL